MATTTYIDELATPFSPLERVAAWFAAISKSIQYSQMIRALSELNDAQLAKIGITRADVPTHAHRIVYQDA